ncbi:MAG TPA: LuxR C-terminal-related transcriptional regulator [Chloroflexota bacterium]|nr:LuxR C-terminal-related transcriptional regulator [Chloroflexota bacterium]
METLAGFDRIDVPFCAVNEFRRIVVWNDRANDLFEVRTDAVMGAEWHAVVHTVRTDGCCALCRTQRAMRENRLATAVNVTVSVKGRHTPVTMVPVPVKIMNRECVGFLMLTASLAADHHDMDSPALTGERVRHLDDDRVIDELTPREREVLACVVEGLDARSIAVHVGISHSTARNYVQRILGKLGARNKAEAVTVALTYNLLAS